MLVPFFLFSTGTDYNDTINTLRNVVEDVHAKNIIYTTRARNRVQQRGVSAG